MKETVLNRLCTGMVHPEGNADAALGSVLIGTSRTGDGKKGKAKPFGLLLGFRRESIKNEFEKEIPMNKTRAVLTVMSILCLMAVLTAFAFASAGPDQAIAMVQKATTHLKKSGPEKAFSDFNNTKGAFVEGELYIFAYDLSGKNVAHGANPSVVGQNLISLTDADGKQLIKEMVELAKSKGSGWVDYKYKNPKTGAIEAKSSYIERVGDYLVGCGIYKKNAKS